MAPGAHLRPCPKEKASSTCNHQAHVVQMARPSGGLGIRVDAENVISKVVPGGAAEADGRLRVCRQRGSNLGVAAWQRRICWLRSRASARTCMHAPRAPPRGLAARAGRWATASSRSTG